jgi:ATP-dependent Clp protease ATP-binding subunit ClpC
LDGTIIFRALTRAEIAEIVDLLLIQVQLLLDEHEIILTTTDAAKKLLAKEGYDPDFGARPLRRIIQKRIEDALSEGILASKFATGDTVQADAVDSEIVFNVVESRQETMSAMPEMI